LSSDIPLTVLGSEYLLSTLGDPEQTAGTRETIDRFRESVRVMVEDLIPEGVDAADPRLDEAIDAIVATGSGLAISQAIGMADADQSAALLVTTLRMWMDRLATPQGRPSISRSPFPARCCRSGTSGRTSARPRQHHSPPRRRCHRRPLRPD